MIIHILANSQDNLKKSFCWDGTPEHRGPVLTPQVAERWKTISFAKAKYTSRSINLYGAEKELYGPVYIFSVPCHDGSTYKNKTDITVDTHKELSRLAVSGIVSDAMWMLIKAVLRFYNIVNIDGGEYFESKEELKDTSFLTKFEDVNLKHLTRVEVAQGFTSKIIGTPEHDWAFTHTIRSRMLFDPYKWQYNVLINWRRLNFIAGTRRSGKTLLSSYIAGRTLFKDRVLASRPVQILYIAISKPKMLQPFTYLETALQSAVEAGVVSIFRYENNYKIVNNMNGNFIQFVSADSKGGVISFAADLIILDEASRMKDEVWLDILPIIEQDRADLYAISTINYETKKGWFYEELVKGEMGYDDEIRSTRVTIDDVEAFTENAKERLKEGLRKYPQRYFAELYSIYPSTSDIFKIEGFFKAIDPPPGVSAGVHYIIGYDPAKETDQGGVLIFNCKERRFEQEKCLVFTEYKEQVTYIIGLKKKYNDASIVIDVTGVGKAVAEMFMGALSCKIYTNRNIAANRFDPVTSEWKVTKKDLVNNMSAMLEMQGVSADIRLTEFKKQLEGFKATSTTSNNTIYEGDGVPDDLISAAYIILWFWGVINGNFSTMLFDKGQEDGTTKGFQGYEQHLEPSNEGANVDKRFKDFIY